MLLVAEYHSDEFMTQDDSSNSQPKPPPQTIARETRGQKEADLAAARKAEGKSIGAEPDARQNKIMGFYEHLEEFRSRLMRCLTVFFVGFIGAYFVSDYVLEALKAPLFAALPETERKLYYTGLFENFLTHLKVAGYSGAVMLSPYFFYEIWAFIAPGLYPKERKMVVPFVTAASGFFIGGALFAYFVLFPVGFKYFVTYGSPTDVPLITMDAYVTTCLRLLLLFGLAFELPVLLVLLGYLGVLDAAFLRQHRRSGIIGITIVAALFAPPDAISMLILGIPMVLMFEGAILVVDLIGRKKMRRSDIAPSNSADPAEPKL